jgi:NADH dehydrogenase FAD-containing subunit
MEPRAVSAAFSRRGSFGKATSRSRSLTGQTTTYSSRCLAFELAETAGAEAERRRWLTFAVVVGGPTGCEVAGQIAELARRTLERDFRAIDPTSAAVILLEADTQILRAFGDHPTTLSRAQARTRYRCNTPG